MPAPVSRPHPLSPVATTNARCPLSPYTVDCGGDNHFNAVNPPGYLASHWHVANS